MILIHMSHQKYLKPGEGEPWAGQVNATPWPWLFLKADKSRLDENLGLEDPTGSIMISRIDIISQKIYLNAGGGDPWAGQVRASPFCSFSLKADSLNLEENFGLDDPTGSKMANTNQCKDLAT